MEKKLISFLLVFSMFGATLSNAQGYVDLKEGKTQVVNGINASFLTLKKKTKKGEDYYRVIVTLTNQDNNWIHLFSTAAAVFIKNNKNALAHFRFVNATGKGLSAIQGKIYAHPILIKVPIVCKKYPPPANPKEDPYHHYLKTYIIGTKFLKGETVSKSFNVRVKEGSLPRVQVLIP